MSRELPPTRCGGPAVGSFGRRSLRGLAAGCTALLVFGLAQPTLAHADDTADRDNLDSQIAAGNQQLDDQNQALTAAVAKAQATHDALTKAQQALASAQAARQKAQDDDTAAQAALATAQDEVTKANADVAQGLVALDSERRRAGAIALNSYRSQGQLASWAALLQSRSTQQLADRSQWNDQQMKQHNQAMDDLNNAQQTFEAIAAKKADAEAQATAAKKSSDDALAAKQTAETSAQQASSQLTAAAASDDAAQADAQKAVNDEKARLADLQTQRDAVDKRIQDRLAAEQAAAAAAAAQAQGGSGQASGATAAASPLQGSSPFIWPVDGQLTSPFGMRLHPILHIWVLHDGQDFGAPCGTPIKAAAAGTVVENYWDTTGFGNRLIVDHGVIGGTAYTTAYNHAEYYIVNVGQHVDQGQVLGYVGTTGYSTGCHLHLNLWVNGKLVDPMPYLP